MKKVISGVIGVVSLGLLAVLCLSLRGDTAIRAEERDRKPEESIYLAYDGVAVYPWEKEGSFYFFVPSCFDWEETELTAAVGELRLDGKQVKGSLPLGEVKKEEGLPFTFSDGETKAEGELVFLQSENVGAVFVETAGGSMKRIDADKEYKENGLILVKDASGRISYGGFLDSIKSRGNATWNTQKKSYAIQLSHASELLGMEEAKEWILLCNVFDGSKLRNKICMDLAEELGLEYTPRGEWADLYLNGRYHGNYLLCEKIQVAENRVEIEDLEEETRRLNGDLQNAEYFEEGNRRGILAERNPEDISGGYLIEKDLHFDQASGFRTKDGNPFSLHAPRYATREQVTYIAEHVQRIEDMILSGDAALFSYLDPESFVLRYLVDEVTLNQDAGITSTYFYKKAGDPLLYSGPVWDYDGSMGGLYWTEWMNHKVIFATDMKQMKFDFPLSWYPYLYRNPAFYERVTEEYAQKLRPYILSLVEAGIDRYAEQVEKSAQMDAVRWDRSAYKVMNYESFENDVRYLKWFLAKRLEFLDEAWLGEENSYAPEGDGSLHTVTFRSGKGSKTVEMPDGERIIVTPEEYLDSHEWWYNVRNGMPYTSDMPVLEDITFEARQMYDTFQNLHNPT